MLLASGKFSNHSRKINTRIKSTSLDMKAKIHPFLKKGLSYIHLYLQLSWLPVTTETSDKSTGGFKNLSRHSLHFFMCPNFIWHLPYASPQNAWTESSSCWQRSLGSLNLLQFSETSSLEGCVEIPGNRISLALIGKTRVHSSSGGCKWTNTSP